VLKRRARGQGSSVRGSDRSRSGCICSTLCLTLSPSGLSLSFRRPAGGFFCFSRRSAFTLGLRPSRVLTRRDGFDLFFPVDDLPAGEAMKLGTVRTRPEVMSLFGLQSDVGAAALGAANSESSRGVVRHE